MKTPISPWIQDLRGSIGYVWYRTARKETYAFPDKFLISS